jgi:hypothetical protein
MEAKTSSSQLCLSDQAKLFEKLKRPIDRGLVDMGILGSCPVENVRRRYVAFNFVKQIKNQEALGCKTVALLFQDLVAAHRHASETDVFSAILHPVRLASLSDIHQNS